VETQKDVIAAATRAGQSDNVARMRDNLRRYERRQPCRVTWGPGDPVNEPGPPMTPQLVAVARAAAR